MPLLLDNKVRVGRALGEQMSKGAPLASRRGQVASCFVIESMQNLVRTYSAYILFIQSSPSGVAKNAMGLDAQKDGAGWASFLRSYDCC